LTGLIALIFFPSRKQAGGGEPLSLSPELSWNLKTDRESEKFEVSEKGRIKLHTSTGEPLARN